MNLVIAFFIAIMYVLGVLVTISSFYALIRQSNIGIPDNRLSEKVMLCIVYLFCHTAYWISGTRATEQVEVFFMFFLAVVFIRWFEESIKEIKQCRLIPVRRQKRDHFSRPQ